MENTASPYLMGDLEASCGLYSSINALRVCFRGIPQGDRFYHDLVRHLVREVDPTLTTYVLRGFNISDVARFLAATAVFVERRLGLTLTFWRPFLRSAKLSQFEYFQDIDRYANCRQHAVILAIGAQHYRFHWTVAVKVTPRTIRVADCCNDVILRTRGLRVAKSGTRCGPSHWMPKATFVLALAPTRTRKKERRT